MNFGKRLMATSTAALLIALSAIPAHAHRAWLLPSKTQVEGKATYITFDLASGDDVFDIASPASKLDGLTITGPDGTSLVAENRFTGAIRSTFDLKLTQAGTYRVSLVTDTVMGRYTQAGETKRFRGAAADLATLIPADATDVQTGHMFGRIETYVSSGKPNDAVLKPVGQGLEIIPITAPENFVAGESASFRAYMDGKPISGLSVSVVPGDVQHRGALKDISATTDDKGEFTVTWPLAQMYWIGASYPARRMEGPPAGAPTGQAPNQPAPQAPTPPQGAGPQGASPQGASPQGASPQSASPQSASPQGAGPRPGFDRPPENRWSYSGTFNVAPF